MPSILDRLRVAGQNGPSGLAKRSKHSTAKRARVDSQGVTHLEIKLPAGVPLTPRNLIKYLTGDSVELVSFAILMLRGEIKEPVVLKSGKVVMVPPPLKTMQWALQLLWDRGYGKMGERIVIEDNRAPLEPNEVDEDTLTPQERRMVRDVGRKTARREIEGEIVYTDIEPATVPEPLG